jgi:hypothetical protein
MQNTATLRPLQNLLHIQLNPPFMGLLFVLVALELAGRKLGELYALFDGGWVEGFEAVKN